MRVVEFNYEPRSHFVDFHNRSQRWSCIVAHRRAGKTVACINDLNTRATYSRKKRPRYGYIAPFYSQAKQIAWDYLKESTAPNAAKVMESSLSVELATNHAKIQLFGADNPDSFRGLYFDGVILDEYGDCRPSLWGEVILPTLADRKGWAVFIGTPKGKNHFYDIRQTARGSRDWFYAELKASQTGILSEEELAAMRAQMTDEQYRQEFECDFEAAVLGTYYAKILAELEGKGHVASVPFDPAFPVEAVLDLGFTDSTAIWFWQSRPDGVAVIDYEEASGQPLKYYFDLLRYKPYEYTKIWLPHDARAKSLQTGRSTIEQFLAEQFPVDIVPNLKLQHGIDAARMLLPYCHFDATNCNDGLEALRAYRRDWDENRKMFRDSPLHDWSSHGADAFRYMALVAKHGGIKNVAKDAAKARVPGYTLHELFQERERSLRRSGRRI